MKPILRNLTLLLAALLTLSLAGCSANKSATTKQEKVSIASFDGVKMSGGSILRAKVTVRNNMGIKLTLTSATLTATSGDKQVARLTLLDEVCVPRKSTTQVELPLRATLENPLRAFGLLKQIKDGELPDLKLSAEATVKALGSKRTIKRDNISLRDILSQLKLFKKRKR